MKSKRAHRKILAITTLFVFLSLSFLATVSAEKDVAYVVKHPFFVNPLFTSILDEMGITYDIVTSPNITTYNLSKYKMILLNNHDFPNPEEIPVNDIPAVLVNGENMADWGWVNKVSKTSQNTLFHVDIQAMNHSIARGFN